MNDKVNARVPVQLDRERYLVFGLRAMKAFEEVTGKNLLKMKQVDDMTATEVGILFWACLLHDDRELTQDQAIDLIDEHTNLAAIAGLIYEARKKAMPESEGKKDTAPLAKKPRRG